MNYIEVLVPPATTKLTTLDTVKAELGIADNTQDALLNTLIEQASSFIKNYCEREFGRATYREFVPSYGNQYLVLSQTPIQSVEYIKLMDYEIPQSNYLILKDKGMIYSRYGWSWEILLYGKTVTSIPIPGSEIPIYEVKYTAGYVLPSETTDGERLPTIIERVCIDLVKIYYYSAQRDVSIGSERFGDYSVTYKENRIMEIANILDSYRRVI